MVGRSTLRNRHHASRPCASVAPSTSVSSGTISAVTSYSDSRRTDESIGPNAQAHPVWPDMPQGQGELFFECTLFLYSVLALFLQYLNLYKTMWWLPKSYWHYSMKFHLINPYLLSCIGLLLGIRVTKCFWNTVTELAMNASEGASNMQILVWRVIEWAAVKTPMFTMVATSFMFSFTRVYTDHPIKSLIYFGNPLLLVACVFYRQIKHNFCRFFSLVSFVINGGSMSNLSSAPMRGAARSSPTTLLEIDSVVHTCSSNPVQIREEVSVLYNDFYLRVKHCVLSGCFTAYFSIIVPCVFIPERSTIGISQYMYIDILWILELFIIVALTSFSLYCTYLVPIQYCDLIHRSASHLGRWKKVDIRQPSSTQNCTSTSTTENVYRNWTKSDGLYSDGAIVRYLGNTYQACAVPGSLTVAAEPENVNHNRFYRLGADPISVVNSMALFQVALIVIQFWMLVLTTDWQHIVTLVLLIFANYLLLAKVFKDRVVIGRIYKPSPDDLQLIKQLEGST